MSRARVPILVSILLSFAPSLVLGQTVRGRVVDPEGTTISGAIVTFRYESGEMADRAEYQLGLRTDEFGVLYVVRHSIERSES